MMTTILILVLVALLIINANAILVIPTLAFLILGITIIIHVLYNLYVFWTVQSATKTTKRYW